MSIPLCVNLAVIDGSPSFSVVFSLFIHYSSFLFVEVWKGVASSLSQHGDTMSAGDEGSPAWGQAFPDGSFVQLDQA